MTGSGLRNVIDNSCLQSGLIWTHKHTTRYILVFVTVIDIVKIEMQLKHTIFNTKECRSDDITL